MKYYKNLIIIFLLLSFTIPASAKEYYISPDGKAAASGTELSPFADVGTALSKASGGNTFIFKPGIYSGQITLSSEYAGTPQSPTVLKSEQKYKAVLHGSTGHNIYVLDGCEWVIIDGFESSGARIDGIKSNADHTVIRNCWVHHNAGQGIAAHNVTGSVIERNLIEFNGSHIHFDHGIYADGSNLTIRQNVVRFNSGYGLNLYSEISQSLVESNLIYGNTRAGILVYCPEEGGNNRVLNNTIVCNGWAFSICKGKGEIIANNIIAYNDTWRDISNHNFNLNKTDISNLTIVNNLFYPVQINHGSNNIFEKPDFAELNKGVFYLKKGSPAIKAGTGKYTAKSDFFGISFEDVNEPDLGCFSYNSELVTDEARKSWYYGWPFYFNSSVSEPFDLWKKLDSK